jgi:transposase
MDTAQIAPTTVILATDEASLYLQATTKVVWHPQGQTPIIKLHPGRESTHFYGALNLATGQETALRTAVMNAEITALFLLRLLATYPGQPILLLWDRAPWHRGQAIQQILKEHPRLEVVYLPPAAPDLNPQEHVWKAARTFVSHNHRFAKLDQLADAFERHLTSTTFPCSLLAHHNYFRLCSMFI